MIVKCMFLSWAYLKMKRDSSAACVRVCPYASLPEPALSSISGGSARVVAGLWCFHDAAYWDMERSHCCRIGCDGGPSSRLVLLYSSKKIYMGRYFYELAACEPSHKVHSVNTHTHTHLHLFHGRDAAAQCSNSLWREAGLFMSPVSVSTCCWGPESQRSL